MKPQSSDTGPKQPIPDPQRSRPRKLSYKEQQELEKLPARIAALEDEQRRLQADIAAPEFYKSPKDRIAAALARTDTVQKELDAVLERWVELDGIGRDA